MATFKNQKKYNTRNNLKKSKPDSESEPEEWVDEESADESSEDESTDESSEEEEEETTDSSYKPPVSKKKNKKIIYSDNESDETDNSKKVSNKSFQKMLATMFPSKYMNEKVKEMSNEKTNEKTNEKLKIKNNKKTNEKLKEKLKDKNKSNKVVSETKLKKFMKTVNHDGSIKTESDESIESIESDESSESDNIKYKLTKHKSKSNKNKKIIESSDDDDDDDDDDDSDYDPNDSNPVNIIFSGFDEYYNGEDADQEILEEDENIDCNSEDEEIFMKDKYEKIETIKQSRKSNKFKKLENKCVKQELIIKPEPDADNEYCDLIELKKHLKSKLDKTPDSKILKRAINDCTKSISKLVMKGRNTNAKKYYELMNGDQKLTSELEYFKKKLSNKEQLKIMKEFNEINTFINIDKPYRLTLLQSNITPKYKATVMQKLNILRQMEPSDPEYYKIKNWVDTFMRVPFGKYKELSVKMSDGVETCSKFMCDAKAKLDECVYGLNDAKLQILQMVGQWITNPSALGTAIAIKGPPGTGKSSLVKEGISQILGREFAFIALGGSGDSSFLEGHSYTYEGSSWGKIVQILIDSKCMNPVIYFDELDKISETPRGEEITGILTHLTDTTQNNQFHDKYFSEVDFDLSKCLFIFSYNDESKVNPILRDRMYRIQTKGYSAKEKVIIARKHLLPKIREQVSFQESDIIIPDETLMYIITNKALTQDEAGVRNLKRCLEIIHTKLNLFRLVKEDSGMFKTEIDLKVSFPMTVSCKNVDALIKNDENQNQSMLSMYV